MLGALLSLAAVIGFDAVIADPATGAMRAEFGLAMGMAIDLKALPAPQLRS
jgi:hypothetical protein